MQSRFWTLCAAGNIILFMFTVAVVYYYNNQSYELGLSLYHRSVAGWADGLRKWRGFYDGLPTGNVTDVVAYDAFLPEGMAAAGCADPTASPVCACLQETYTMGRTLCVQAARSHLKTCTFNTRPLIHVEEMSVAIKPFALLDALNIWGMMGSVLIWIRQYTTKDEEAMPYWMQLVLGTFAAIIHCSVLEPTIMTFLAYVPLVLAFSGLCYSHKTDPTWWVSTYQIQYFFVVPTLTLLGSVLTQRRDVAYVIFMFILSMAYGLVAFAKTLLEQAKESHEQTMMVVICQSVLLCLYVTLLFISYSQTGLYYLESVQLIWCVYSLYAGLAMLTTLSIKRVFFMELLLRIIVTASMLMELGLAA
jgi:hypothetical protein